MVFTIYSRGKTNSKYLQSFEPPVAFYQQNRQAISYRFRFLWRMHFSSVRLQHAYFLYGILLQARTRGKGLIGLVFEPWNRGFWCATWQYSLFFLLKIVLPVWQWGGSISSPFPASLISTQINVIVTSQPNASVVFKCWAGISHQVCSPSQKLSLWASHSAWGPPASLCCCYWRELDEGKLCVPSWAPEGKVKYNSNK